MREEIVRIVEYQIQDTEDIIQEMYKDELNYNNCDSESMERCYELSEIRNMFLEERLKVVLRDYITPLEEDTDRILNDILNIIPESIEEQNQLKSKYELLRDKQNLLESVQTLLKELYKDD